MSEVFEISMWLGLAQFTVSWFVNSQIDGLKISLHTYLLIRKIIVMEHRW